MTTTSDDTRTLEILARLAQLPPMRNGFNRAAGNGSYCIMETVAYINGETPVSDMPACVAPDLRLFSIAWNDGINDDATRTQLLRPFVPALLTSTRSDYARKQRTFIALDWLLRDLVPTWLRGVGLLETASAFHGLERIDDEQHLRALTALLARAVGEVEQLREQEYGPPRGLARSDAQFEMWQQVAGIAAQDARVAESATPRSAAACLIQANLDMDSIPIIRHNIIPLFCEMAVYCAHIIALRTLAAVVHAAGELKVDLVSDLLERTSRESLVPFTALLQRSGVELYRRLCNAPDSPEAAALLLT